MAVKTKPFLQAVSGQFIFLMGMTGVVVISGGGKILLTSLSSLYFVILGTALLSKLTLFLQFGATAREALKTIEESGLRVGILVSMIDVMSIAPTFDETLHVGRFAALCLSGIFWGFVLSEVLIRPHRISLEGLEGGKPLRKHLDSALNIAIVFLLIPALLPLKWLLTKG